MKSILFRNLLRPLLERVGTAMAVWLIAAGASAELVEQFITALLALVLISGDLVVARLNRDAD